VKSNQQQGLLPTTKGAPVTKPARLYKYVPPTEWAFKNLVRNQLWFSSPQGFNDPYDCQVPLELSKPADAELVAIVHGSLSGVPAQVAQEKLARLLPGGSPSSLVREQVESAYAKLFEEQRSTNLTKRGVCCFSEQLDSFPMWGHYSDSHQGFCLEFDTTFDPFQKVHAVSYTDARPVVNASSLILGDDSDALITMVATKAACWAYEKEWRVIHMEADTAYGYEPAALTAVYLGMQANDDTRFKVSTIVKGTAAKVYQMERDETAFRLVPKLL